MIPLTSNVHMPILVCSNFVKFSENLNTHQEHVNLKNMYTIHDSPNRTIYMHASTCVFKFCDSEKLNSHKTHIDLKNM
jgi:hypothetical protein